jgi:hypothetical protein
MKILNYLIRCQIWGHEPPDDEEDRVFEQQYFKIINTDCIKCDAPIKIWIEPNCDEDHYMIQEGV